MKHFLTGTRGVFKFLAPFDIYNTDKVLELISIQNLNEMVLGDLSPFELIYKPVNLTEDNLKEDIANNVNIITFKDKGGCFAYIPDRYISDSIPTESGVVYVKKGIAINLGPLPKNENLNSLKQDIATLIEARIGITPAIEIVELSSDTLISTDTHNAYTAKRDIIRTNKGNYYNQLVEMTKLAKDRKDHIEGLECYICKNIP